MNHLAIGIGYCETCKAVGQHRQGCPEQEDDYAECSLCGVPLEEDEVQICRDCAAAHPGD